MILNWFNIFCQRELIQTPGPTLYVKIKFRLVNSLFSTFNLKVGEGEAPLHISSKGKNIELIFLLLEHGAIINLNTKVIFNEYFRI